jgi:DNA-binding MarR family transcriptional regulator
VTDPDPYHELSARERDHLLAAAWYAAENDTLPSGRDVTRTVETIADTTVSINKTTPKALRALADAGLVERIPDGGAKRVRVTDEGYRALARGAARLDAAATVEPDGIVEVNEGP